MPPMNTGQAAATPTIRLAARILLFRTDSRAFGRAIWITPGGGLEEGETYEEGAHRELWEETGLRAEIGPCAWINQYEFTFENVRYGQSQRFYVVRCANFSVSKEGWTDEERGSLAEARWWTLEELTASEETFRPPQLLALLPSIIAGEYPTEPIDCGA